jgi:hypothetical protein
MAITLDGTAGTTTPALTNSALTSGRVTYAGTSGVLQDSANLTFDGSSLSVGGQAASGAVTVYKSTGGVQVSAPQLNLQSSVVDGTTSDGPGINLSNATGAVVNIATNGSGAIYFFRRSTAGGAWGEAARFDTNSYLLVGYTSSNGAYKLQVNSQIFATNATIATSDARYKKDVTPISGGLDLVNKLNPVSFNWKPHPVHDFDTANTDVGFIAQEVQSALADSPYLPNVVKSNQTELPDGTKEDFLGIADGKLIPILVKAIQELTARVAALEAK